MSELEQLINIRAVEQVVETTGAVTKKLPTESIKGAPHQRFVIATSNGLTVLLTINLEHTRELAVEEGDLVRVRGMYVYDFRGGYIHQIYHYSSLFGEAVVERKKITSSPRAYAASQLYNSRESNRYVEVEGNIEKLLVDDLDQTPHQKFIIKTSLHHSILIVTSLDHMPHIPLQIGDHIEVAGIYVWNKYGGLVHITHHDHHTDGISGWVYVSRLGKMFQ